MRKQLAKLSRDQRRAFTATFVRYGQKSGWATDFETTLLFRDITDVETNTLVADHLWFKDNKGFGKYKFREGDAISFCARVGVYLKGYVNYREFIDERTEDYRLTYPTKIVKLKRQNKKVTNADGNEKLGPGVRSSGG